MEEKKNKGAGLIGTVVFHAVLVAFLVFFGFSKVEPREEEGIEVMLGEVISSSGTELPMDPNPSPAEPETEVTTVPPQASEPTAAPEVNEEVVTQEVEDAPAIAEAKKKKEKEKEKKREEEAKKKAAEQERIKQEEKRKAEEAEQLRIAQEKKRKEEAIRNKVNNAFAGGAQAGQHGTASSGSGAQGNPFGNSDKGANAGNAGWGDYDLGGRGIRGGLPKPNFTVNESGVVVVSITVNEDGKVINAIVARGTTTSSAQLRNSALTAAKKAVFEVKSDIPTQSGTITYRFDSDN